MSDDTPKWQPILVILRNGGRLECDCGSLAVIVIGVLDKEDGNTIDRANYWCQDCYHKAQMEED